MKIALAQTSVRQAAFDENLENAAAAAKAAKAGGAELVVFPEMFLGGFSYPANKLALDRGRNFEGDVARMARDAGIFVAGSVPARAERSDLPANRMLLANPDGGIEMRYDKIHLFGVFNEDKYVAGGEGLSVGDTPLGRMGLSVCYDLRFPEMFVQMALRDARLVILSAAWPHPRMAHFRTLARARAIEMQGFFVCVNQAGPEDFGAKRILYGGESCAVDPWGETLCECRPDEPDLAFCEIDYRKAAEARARIPALDDRKPHFYR